MKQIIFSTLAAILFASPLVFAQEIQFGEMISGGMGCPSTSDKKPALQIIGRQGTLRFSDYNLKASVQLIDRKNCNVRLPFSVEAGYQVGILVSSAQGKVSQPRNVNSTITVRASLVGAEPQNLMNTWSDKTKSRFRLINAVAGQYAWSNCSGKDSILTLDSNMIIVRQEISQTVSVSLNEMNFDFVVRRCEN